MAASDESGTRLLEVAEPATIEPATEALPIPQDKPRKLSSKIDRPDAAFRWIARGGGTIVVTVMSLVGLFLAYQGFTALQVAGPSFLTEQSWDPNSGKFGIAAVLAGTFFIALTAIAFALPLALGTALYISEYAPAKIKNGPGAIVEQGDTAVMFSDPTDPRTLDYVNGRFG